MSRMGKARTWVQGIWTFVTNSYLTGFVQGRIYQGPLKNLCVPGLNCYSCPGAVASCPIGALQAVIGSSAFRFSFYVTGFLFLIGALCGRFVCGWLCPFGFLQDLLYRIPFVRKVRTFRGDRVLRWMKYGVLVIFVILLPLYVTDILGQGQPAFCKWICPAGTLEGGWPLVALNSGLRDAVGWLYAWKNVLLAGTLVTALLVYRPFCRYLCPLGAVYACFNSISLYRYHFDPDACVHCGRCAAACGMGIDPVHTPNAAECIRCGKCADACPTGALTPGWPARCRRTREKEEISRL